MEMGAQYIHVAQGKLIHTTYQLRALLLTDWPGEEETSTRFPTATSPEAASPDATLASVEPLLSRLARSEWSKEDCSALATVLEEGRES